MRAGLSGYRQHRKAHVPLDFGQEMSIHVNKCHPSTVPRGDIRHCQLACGKTRGLGRFSFSVISFQKGSVGMKGMTACEALILLGLFQGGWEVPLWEEILVEGVDSKLFALF